MKRLTRFLAAWFLSLILFTAARADILPAGIYTIGEDFPAGSCTVSLSGDDEFVSVYLWGSAVNDHETNGGLIYRSRLKPGESLGKIPLNEGNILAVRFGSIELQPYTGLELDWEQTNLLLRGIYETAGVDHNCVGAFITIGYLISLFVENRKHPLCVNLIFGASERNHSYSNHRCQTPLCRRYIF